MAKKLFKAGLSIVLAFSLAIAPSTTYAKATAVQPQVLMTSSTTTAPVKSDLYAETRKLAETKATLLTTYYGVTSVQYALIDNGEIVISGVAGVNDKSSSTPVTETNMYGIGSVSKIFTTVAVLQLVEEGKVNLDAPVTNYIPEFTMADPRYKDITVRMLLNHSSGLMGCSLSNSLLLNDRDTSAYDNFLNLLKTSRLKADPGEFSVYSNDGFTLAEILVEKVTGNSFTDYIKKNISEPLGLYNTKTPQDDFNQERLAKTYVPGSNQVLPVENVNMIGAGGIYSSAKNLCEFAKIFMKNSESSVLSKSYVKAMENSEYLKGLWTENKSYSLTYGLGWDSVNTYPFEKYGIKALVKGGDTLFYHGNLTVLPEENMAVAVLSSGGSSLHNQVIGQEILLSALKEKGVINEIQPDVTFTKPVKANIPDNVKQYAGYYGNLLQTIKVTMNADSTLSISNALAPEAGSEKFIYTGDNKFYSADGSGYITFEKAKNGNTYLYTFSYLNLPGLGQTVSDGFQGQKLEDNPITDEVKSAWEQRSDKLYLMVNEKYSSSLYVSSELITMYSMPVGLEGYFLNNAIKDTNTAITTLKIPGNLGRDISDYTFFKDGNTEYLKAKGYIYISEKDVPTLPASAFQVAIKGNGYAQWYKIGKGTSGKKIKVTLPENASFTIVNSDGRYVFNSYVNNKNTVTLPKDGYIVFAGGVNAHFKVSYVK